MYSAVLTMAPEDLSTIRFSVTDLRTHGTGTYSDVGISSMAIVGVHPMDYNDYLDVIPWEAWNSSLYFDPNHKSSYLVRGDEYLPTFAVPKKIRDLEPLWKN